MIGLMVGKDLRNGGPLVMLICTIAKLIKNFGTIASVFEFILIYIICAFQARFRIKNIQIRFIANH